MARAPIAGRGPSGAARNRIVLSVPAENTTVNYNAPSSRTFVLQGFEPNAVDFVRNGSNLEMRFDNGAVINLVRYFAVGKRSFANFEMQDSNVVGGRELLAELKPGLDLTPTAAGPAAPRPAPGGSGVGEYRGDMPELIGGVDRLGSLPSDEWERTTAFRPEELGEATRLVDLSISSVFTGSFVDEAGLPNGTNPGHGLESEWSPLSLPAGLSIVGVPLGGDTLQIEGRYVTLYVRHIEGSNYEFMYVLKNPFSSAEGDNERNLELEAEIFTLQITDGYYSGTIKVAASIYDDIPIATLGAGESENVDDSGAFLSGYNITGDWDIRYGADGAHPEQPMAVSVSVRLLDDKGNPGAPINGDFDVVLGRAVDLNIGGVSYGSITFNADGTYVFRPAPNVHADFNIRLGGRDSDNDLSYSGDGINFTVTPNEPPVDPIGRDQWFHEANLDGGTVANASQLCREVGLPDGWAIDVNTPATGGGVWQASADGSYYTLEDPDAYGFLTYYPASGSGEDYKPPRLTYTLTKNAPHEEPDPNGNYDSKDKDPSETFLDVNIGKITLVDAAGNRFEKETEFKIYDDAPVVNFDAVTGETVYNGDKALGTWSVVYGADGGEGREIRVKLDGGTTEIKFSFEELASASAGPGLEIKIDGVVYGYLQFIKGGDFIFTASPNTIVPDSAKLLFTLAGIDKDGDEATQVVPITIVPPPGPGPLELKDPTPIDESSLVDGNEDDLIREVIIPPGFIIDTSKDGWKPDPNNPGKYQKPTEDGKGMLTYDPDDNTLEYELKEPLEHPDDTPVIPDIVDEITLIDDKGNSFPGNPVEVPIRDDSPTIDTDLEDGNTVVPGGSIEGDFEIDFGGDGPADDKPVEIIVDAGGKEETFYPPTDGGTVTYPITDKDGKPIGELEVSVDEDGNGHFEFKPDPTTPPGTDVEIEIIGKDKDGTPTEGGNIDISIVDPDGPGVNYLGDGVVLYEANLENGTAYANGMGLEKSIDVPAGFSVDLTKGGWAQQPDNTYVLQGTYGHLTCSADGKNLTYTLDKRAQHEEGKGANTIRDVINGIVLKNEDGKTFDPMPARVTIVDDLPETFIGAGTESNIIKSGSSYEGSWQVQYGADEAATSTPLQLKVYLGSEVATINVVPGQKHAVSFGGEKFGDITFNAVTGKYTFEAAPNKSGTLRLELTATDKDGDKTSDDFIIKVEPVSGPEVDYITVEEKPDEANLPGGTDPNKDDLTQPVPLPPGFVVDVDKDGWKPDGNGNYVLDPDDSPGHLTWNPKDKELTYTLDEATEHPGKGVDEIPIHLQDEEHGNSFPVDVVVPIENDIPTTEMNTPNPSVESGKGPLVGTWEVEYGADDPSDDDPLTLVVSTPGCKKPQEIELDPNSKVDQQHEVIIDGVDYGTITIKPDGTFEFSPKPDLPPTRLDLELQAKDGDGDVSVTPPLVISIIPPDGPDIGYLTADKPFDEANFLNGTRPDVDALTQELNLPEGYTVDYTQPGWKREAGTNRYVFKSPEVVDENGVVTNGFGKLTYDASTGKLTYTLTSKVFNTPAENDDAIDSIPLVIKDGGGNSYAIKAVVDILDDKPELDFSGEAVVKSGRTYEGDWDYNFGADGSADVKPIVITVSDGVSTKEYTVAVGSSTEISLGGKRYGALTLNADKTYSFKSQPDVEGKLSFAMTITDSDGDKAGSGSPVIIDITKDNWRPEIGPADGKGIFESHLPGGTDPDQDLLTKELTVPVLKSGELCPPDTTGWTKTGENTYTLQGPRGVLKWDGDAQKLYFTLDKSSLHPGVNKSGEDDEIINQMTINVKDPFGNTFAADVKIPIYDDAPDFDARFDKDTVESGGTISGDLGLEYGADGKSALTSEALIFRFKPDGETAIEIPIVPGRPQVIQVGSGADKVTYGTLTVNKDGTFTFDLEPNLEKGFDVNFGATDSDGDTTWAFDKDFHFDPDPGEEPDDLIGGPVSESYLPGGTQEGPGSAGQLVKVIEVPEGYDVDTSSGWSSLGGNLYEKTSPYGKLTYNSLNNELTYTLVTHIDHPKAGQSGPDDVVTDSFDLVLKNENGHKFDVKAEVGVQDDAPTVSIASSTQPIPSGGQATGKFSFDHGADGEASSGYLKLVISDSNGEVATFADADLKFDGTGMTVGKYGVLTIDANGNFTFKANPDLTESLFFVLSAKDGDGDETRNDDPFELKIQKPSDKPDDLSFDSPVPEKHLPEGTLPSPSGLSKNVAVQPGYTIDVSKDGWSAKGFDANEQMYVYEKVGTYGKLTYYVHDIDKYTEGDGLVFTLTSRAPHGVPSSATDEIFMSTMGQVHYKDSLGNTYAVGTKFPIEDDAPLVDLGANATATGGQDFSGTYKGVHGADGPASSESMRIKLDFVDEKNNNKTFSIEKDVVIGSPITLEHEGVDYGVITFTSATNYVYRIANNVQARVTLTLTLKDGDGDERSDSKVISIDTKGVTEDTLTATVDEAHISADPAVNQDYDGSNPNAALATKTIALPPLPGGQTGTWGIVTDPQVTNANWVKDPAANVWTLQTTYGYLTYTEAAGAEPNLTFTLLRAPTEAGDSFIHSIPDIMVKDKAGNTDDINVEITINDDAPSVSMSASGPVSVKSGETYADGNWSAEFGADGPAQTNGRQLRIYEKNSGVSAVLDNIEFDKDIEIKIDGKVYGTLKFDSSTEKFSFAAASNTEAVLDFTLTVVDGDGDKDQASFSLDIYDQVPPIVFSGTVNEKYLSDGSDPNLGSLNQALSFDPSLGYTIDFSYGNWVHNSVNKIYTLKLGNGTLIAAEDGKSVSYRLEGRYAHGKPNSDTDLELIVNSPTGIRIQDASGNKYVRPVQITVVDDAPKVGFGPNPDPNEAVLSGHSKTFDGGFDFSFGADGAAATDGLLLTYTIRDENGRLTTKTVSVSPEGQSEPLLTSDNITIGSVTFDKDTKEFIFKAESDIVSKDKSILVGLQLQATDGDGDVKKSDLFEITIKKPDGPIKDNIAKDLECREEHLPGGTDEYAPNHAHFTQAIDLTRYGDYVPDTSLWTDHGDGTYTMTGSFGTGTLKWDSNAKLLTYLFERTGAHNGPNSPTEDVEFDVFPNFKLKDAHGNTYEMDCEVKIVDDGPTADLRVSGGEVDPGDSFTLTWDYEYGADGKAAQNDLVLTVTAGGRANSFSGDSLKLNGDEMLVYGNDGTIWGYLSKDPSGKTFTYRCANNAPGSLKSGEVKFSLVSRDKEGDSASAEVSKTIGEVTDPEWKIGDNQFFDEANLVRAPGIQEHTGTNPSQTALEKPLKEVDLYGYTLVPLTSDGWVETSSGSNVWRLEGDYGYLVYNVNTKYLGFRLTKSYDAHQKEGVDGSGKGSLDDYVYDFNGAKVTVEDAKGNPVKVGIAIHIHDDGPEIGAFDVPSDMQRNGQLVSGKEYAGNLQCDYGADGPAAADSLILCYGDKNNPTEVKVTYGVAIPLVMNGVSGSITFHANGGYTFKADSNQPSGSWNFWLKATDGDGDMVISRDITLKVEKPVYNLDLTIKDAFNEAYLPEGTEAGGSLVKFFDLKGLTVDTTGWTPQGGQFILAAGNGRFVYSNGSLSYELTSAHDHTPPASGSDKNIENIDLGAVTITLKDAYGNTYTAGQGAGNDFNISMRVQDDVPAPFIIGVDSSGNVVSGGTISGRISPDARPGDPLDVGADGPAAIQDGKDGLKITVTLTDGGPSTGPNSTTLNLIGISNSSQSQDVIIDGIKYGTFTLQPNGQFSFKLEGNTMGMKFKFDVRLEDSDGDSFEQHFNVDVLDPNRPPTYLTFVEKFDEQYLSPDGSSSQNPVGSKLEQTVRLDDRYTVDNQDGSWAADANGVLTRTSATGTLTYDPRTHEFTYKLTAAGAHKGDGRDDMSDLFENISLKDGSNNTFKDHLRVEAVITDDIPSIDFTTSPSAPIVSGQDYLTGQWAHKFGADKAFNGESNKFALTVTVDSSGATENFDVTLGQRLEIKVGTVTYGYLTMGSNGKYTFEAEPNITEQLELALTIKDGDGDIDTARTTLSIEKPTPIPPEITGNEVNESALPADPGSGFPGGTGGGTTTTPITLPPASEYTLDTSDPTVWKPQQDGTLVNDKDPHGKLVYDPSDGSLVYVLEKPLDHTVPGKDSQQKVIPDITFKDPDGNFFDFDIEFDVVDDIPTVEITDLATLPTGGKGEIGQWDVSYGADGNKLADNHFSVEISRDGVTSIVSVPDYKPGDKIAIPGYGDLYLNSDGSVYYEAEPDATYTIYIKIRATDSEGDVNSANDPDTLVLTTRKPGGPTFPNAEVYEKFLQNGSEEGQGDTVFWINPKDASYPNYDAANAQFTVDLKAGGWKPLDGTPNTYVLADFNGSTLTSPGRFLCDSDGSNLRYELVKPHNHPAPPSGQDSDINDYLQSYRDIVFRDAAGNTHEVDLSAKVVDDIPIASFDKDADQIDTGKTYDGDYELTFGADSSPDGKPGIHLVVKLLDENGNATGHEMSLMTGTGSVSIIINNRTYGELVLQEGSQFTFKANPALVSDPVGFLAMLEFHLDVTDRDGDTAKSNPFRLTLKKPPHNLPPPPTDDELTLYEANLPAGTDPDPSALTSSWWDVGPFTVDTSQGGWTRVSNVWILQGKMGTLTLDDTLTKIKYTLTQREEHPKHADGKTENADDVLTDLFDKVVILDADNNQYGYPIEYTVHDDMPEITLDKPGADIGESDSFTCTGDFTLKLGADDVAGKTNDAFTLKLDIIASGSPEYDGSVNTEIQIPRAGTPANAPIEVRTNLGKLYLEYDPTTNTVTYKYVANRGTQGVVETITYTLVDKDQDTEKESFVIKLEDDVKEAYLTLDEAALSFGSNTPGSGERTDEDELRDLAFDRTVDIEWDVASIANSIGYDLKADGDRDGQYDSITWVADGANLLGYADGEVAIRISAIFEGEGANRHFTGKITAELLRAFEHGKAEGNDLELKFDVKFNQIDSSGDKVPSTVEVKIVDDSPFTGTKEHPIVVEEVPERFEEVFIVLDFSDTMKYEAHTGDGRKRWQVALDSLVALAESYEKNGITANFTITAFASTATLNPAFDGISGEDFLALYNGMKSSMGETAARQQLYDLLSQKNMGVTIGSATSYQNATQALMDQLNKAMDPNDPRADHEKTVFFMTDGMSTDGAPTAWYEYLRNHPDDFTVFTIGMGGDEIKEQAKNMLTEMAGGDDSHFVMVENFGDLEEELQNLIKPVSGDLLENIGSADGNDIQFMWILPSTINGSETKDQVKNGKDVITVDFNGKDSVMLTLGDEANPVKIVVYKDGTYEVVSGNVAKDFYYRIVIDLVDKDGDAAETEAITLIIKDAKPIAYDNIANYDVHAASDSNMSGDGAGFNGSNGSGWTFTPGSGSFVDQNDAKVTVPIAAGNAQLPDGFVGDHYLQLVTDYQSDTAYLDMTGTRQYLIDLLTGANMLHLNAGSLYPSKYGLASYDFKAVDGQVTFGWHATGDLNDAAFYLLFNSKGELVAKGLLAQFAGAGLGSAEGVVSIDLPMNSGADDYRLVFGAIEGANGAWPSTEQATLYVNAVVLTESAYDYKGNILTDPSPAGDVDLLYDMATLHGVYYTDGSGQKHEALFNGNQQIELQTANGTLIVNKNGDYIYKVKAGLDPKAIVDEFTYIIEDRDGGVNNQDEANLIIKWQAPQAVEKVAAYEAGVFEGNAIRDPNFAGDVDQCYTTSYIASATVGTQTLTFTGPEDSKSISIDNQGKLTMKGNGEYVFTPSGSAGSVDVEVVYTLKDGTADQGKLVIKLVDAYAYDNVAVSAEAYLGVEKIDDFAAGVGQWKAVGSVPNPTVGGFPSNLLKPQDHDALPPANDRYLKISGKGELSGDALEKMFDLDSGVTLAERLEVMGLENVAGAAVNTLTGSFAERTFSTTGGKLVFDWAFGGKQANPGYNDAAIYVLQDSSGNVVVSGLLSQLLTHGGQDVRKYGVAEIDVPISSDDREYTLYIGQVRVGDANATDAQRNTQLVIGSMVVQEERCHFAGNLIEDASPDGFHDYVGAGAEVISVTYHGVEYKDFDSDGNLTINSRDTGGKLIVHKDGSYFYMDTPGSDGSLVNENFQYTIKSNNSTDSAELFIRGSEFIIEGDVRESEIDLTSSLYGADAPYLVLGSNGDEKIIGGVNSNVLYGGGGDDLIYGGAGNNTISGGAGSDTFAWDKNCFGGKDIITDFSTSQADKLKFTDLLSNNQDLEGYLTSHLKNVNFDKENLKLSFTIEHSKGSEKTVELNFVHDDSGFNSLGDSPADDVIISFLIQHSIS